jgi:uncharacterized membrane protein
MDKLRRLPPLLLALLGFAAWISAGYLLFSRVHLVYGYEVVRAEILWDWRPLVLLGMGAVLSAGAWYAARPIAARDASGDPVPALWLFSSAIIPLLEQFRQAAFPPEEIPGPWYLEPLFFAFISGMAAWRIVGRREDRWLPNCPEPALHALSPWFWGVMLLSATLTGWWFYQGHLAYNDYLLGFQDFGIFARRIANTWEGRGFLALSPHWPAFNDHFYPGLLVLVPLWPLWPDAHLFILLQAVCLAASGPIMYGMTRRLGATPAGAAAWAGAYLAYPAVGQLNLSLTYGFHEVSMALPFLMGALWALFAGRHWLALGLTLAGCSFKEDIFALVAGLALALTLLEWLDGRLVSPGKKRKRKAAERVPAHAPITGLSAAAWLRVFAGFAVAFVLVMTLTRLLGPAHTWRFQHLGSSPSEILLSPLTKPGEFFQAVFQRPFAWYLLSILVPAGLPLVLRGWPVLLALIPPLGFLSLWGFAGAISIAMHYVTELIPIVFLAALVGTIRAVAPGGSRGLALSSAGVLVLTTSLVATAFLGSLPYSRENGPGPFTAQQRADLADHYATLAKVEALVGGPDASTLASARLASHLLGAARLETVFYAIRDREALQQEAGPDRSWIELFDWIALDYADVDWNHSLADLHTVAQAAQAAGYKKVVDENDVEVYRRPDVKER